MITIRQAGEADFNLVADFIRKLADYEKLAHEVRFDDATLHRHLFGPRPAAEVLIGEVDGVASGFALYFQTFSTFEGKPGIWLEDLFVEPQARGAGLGRALLSRLAALVIERGGARLEWNVLDWNELGKGFYRSIGAGHVDGWERWRMQDDALAALARG
ncbi:GNAT superfamily N-acetyltransferase [Sphingomonas sp. BE123]|uniref:GNAT family N-acetyltransferase n=1 Tax=Sphingomonas sp. BE123 TaxID=2817842 RepID=UPI0028549E71|nr:GNAT family N-acetyltransferase [Sphingomonas sp. BE123]MDR6853119.1 GNAT superfamily N-acetyltransferase [Sphingomonas sp. BE123]